PVPPGHTLYSPGGLRRSPEDLGDDLDEEFADLDDPDGLLVAGASTRAGGPVNGNGAGSANELLDDEELDLLGDVDTGADDRHPDNGNGNGDPVGHGQDRIRTVGEARR
ncbi:hypothetical protein HF577_36685, partial [Pseudonocardia xinjiangensis]